LGRYPQLLTGAVAFDSVTNFYRRYSDFGPIARTRGLQALARIEVGGTPRTNPQGYVLRSPSHWATQIAGSGVPLQLWWSDADEIVVDQRFQSAAFYDSLQRIGARGSLERVMGSWGHTAESYRDLQLPGAVRWLGLDR